jgi:hypothetical protein
MSSWIHCHIYNQSSYDLKVLESHVRGSGILGVTGNPRWFREPPSAIPASTGADGAFSGTDDGWLSNVSVSVACVADVDGFPLTLTFSASANEHPAGGQGQNVEMSKDKMINVHVTARVTRPGEREVNWTLKDWPD